MNTPITPEKVNTRSRATMVAYLKANPVTAIPLSAARIDGATMVELRRWTQGVYAHLNTRGGSLTETPPPTRTAAPAPVAYTLAYALSQWSATALKKGKDHDGYPIYDATLTDSHGVKICDVIADRWGGSNAWVARGDLSDSRSRLSEFEAYAYAYFVANNPDDPDDLGMSAELLFAELVSHALAMKAYAARLKKGLLYWTPDCAAGEYRYATTPAQYRNTAGYVERWQAHLQAKYPDAVFASLDNLSDFTLRVGVAPEPINDKDGE